MSSPAPTQPLSPSGGDGTAQREIANFVAAVRAQLSDLSVDEITELTGGLEADLTDALAEEGATPAQRYGDPAEYARELRTAAGLPPRDSAELAAEARRRRLYRFLFGPAWLTGPPTGMYPQAVHSLEQKPWWPAVREFLIVLRPTWWVLRAWVAVQVILLSWGQHGMLAGGLLGVLILIAAVVGSVELGRRRDRLNGWQTNLVAVGNLLAVLLVIPIAVQTGTPRTVYQSDGSYSTTTGLSADGSPITNVFPYDSNGRPLTGVQLYDQDGRPLEVGGDVREHTDDVGNSFQLVPGSGQGTPPRWNVYPMQHRSWEYDVNGNQTYGPAVAARTPFVAVPPLLAAATATPTTTPTPSTTPEATASSEPTASLEPTASPEPTAGATAKPKAKQK
jgi:hypothetical protein